jgi:hypothetical protein
LSLFLSALSESSAIVKRLFFVSRLQLQCERPGAEDKGAYFPALGNHERNAKNSYDFMDAKPY